MLSHQEPSFCETPNKTTIFVVEFREKNGVPRSTKPFLEGGGEAFYDLSPDFEKATDK